MVFLFLAACGGTVASKVRPADPTYARAVGERCVVGDGDPQPLVVDWRPEARADLEVAMQRGVAVVAYDCKSLRVLPDCTVDGAYRFVGVSYKDQRLQLTTKDEIKANLPAGIIAASFDSQLSRGASLDVQLAIVGKQVATAADVTRSHLHGRCAGATHVVRAVTTGAFTLDSTANAAVDASGKVMGAGGSTKGSSDKQWHQQDGDRAACAAASADATSPPAACRAPLRLDLAAVLADPVALPGPAAASAQPVVATSMAPVGACPPGLVWSAGACLAPRANAPHACKSGDIEDCKLQCERGDGESCDDLGFEHLTGRRVPLDRAAARELFTRSCELGNPYGCNNLGALMIRTTNAPQADLDRAMALFRGACDQEPKLCANYAVVHRDGDDNRGKRPQRAAELFSRACLGGDGGSCHDLALVYYKGDVVPKDPMRGAELEIQSCRLGFMFGCAIAGTRYLYGEGVDKSETTAVAYFKRACSGKDQWGCGLLGLMIMSGEGGVSRDVADGKRRIQQACNNGSDDSCKLWKIVQSKY